MAAPSLQPGDVDSCHPEPERVVLADEIDRAREDARLDFAESDRVEGDKHSCAQSDTAAGDETKKASRQRALKVVLTEIAQEAHSIGTATGAAVLLVRDHGPVCIASSGSTALEVSAYLSGFPPIRRADAPQLCQDVQRDPKFDQRIGKRLGVRSFIAIPIRDRNKDAVAIMEVFSSQADAFDHRDLFLLKCLGERVADHIDFAKQTQALEKEIADASEPPAAPSGATISRGALRISRWQMPFVGNIWDLLLILTIILVAMLLGWAVGRPQRGSARRAADELTSDADRKVEAARPSPKGADPDPSSGSLLPTAQLAQTANSSVASSELDSRKVASPPDNLAPTGPTGTNHPVPKPLHKGQPDGLVIFEGKKQVFPHESSEAASARENYADGTEEESTSKPADGNSVVTVSEQVAEEHLIKRVEPDYPESARQQRLQGTAVLDVRVDKRGVVKGLSQVSGDPQLSLLAAKAVRQWKFLPLIRNGVPVSFESQITVSFALP